MDNIKFLHRNDGNQKVYLSESALDVADILKENYGYVYDSMAEENFILKSPQCNLFKELVYDNKVVGFCSYDHSREFLTAALNNIYILPEFRGNGIFLNELEKTMSEHNKPSIVEPTRLVVEILIKYGFAEMIFENVAASSIEFIVPGEHVLSNVDYNNSEELSTHFYDLNLCACIHFLDLNESFIAYSAPLNYDIINYDCNEYRMELDDDYFSNLKNEFLANEDKIKRTITALERSLPIKKYTLEDVIGQEDNLSPYIESLIDDAHITYADALKIREQMKKEYEEGMILDESLLIRLAYLFEKNPHPTIKSHSETCPYCEMPIDSHDKFCHFCGINLKKYGL